MLPEKSHDLFEHGCLLVSDRSRFEPSNGGLFVSPGHGIHPERVIDSYELILVRTGTLFLGASNRFHAGTRGHARPLAGTGAPWDRSIRLKYLILLDPFLRGNGPFVPPRRRAVRSTALPISGTAALDGTVSALPG
jgi:hypothetical protein